MVDPKGFHPRSQCVFALVVPKQSVRQTSCFPSDYSDQESKTSTVVRKMLGKLSQYKAMPGNLVMSYLPPDALSRCKVERWPYCGVILWTIHRKGEAGCPWTFRAHVQLGWRARLRARNSSPTKPFTAVRAHSTSLALRDWPPPVADVLAALQRAGRLSLASPYSSQGLPVKTEM